jgi:hypothetical protein
MHSLHILSMLKGRHLSNPSFVCIYSNQHRYLQSRATKSGVNHPDIPRRSITPSPETAHPDDIIAAPSPTPPARSACLCILFHCPLTQDQRPISKRSAVTADSMPTLNTNVTATSHRLELELASYSERDDAREWQLSTNRNGRVGALDAGCGWVGMA